MENSPGHSLLVLLRHRFSSTKISESRNKFWLRAKRAFMMPIDITFAYSFQEFFLKGNTAERQNMQKQSLTKSNPRASTV